MVEISGSCLCGQLHFSGDVKLIRSAICHCIDCQKATGAAFATNVFVVSEGLSVEGEQMRYTHQADRGSTMTKVNCAKCGSPVLGYNSAREGLTILRAGVVDQKDLIKPDLTVYTDSKIPSTVLDPNTKQYAKMPT